MQMVLIYLLPPKEQHLDILKVSFNERENCLEIVNTRGRTIQTFGKLLLSMAFSLRCSSVHNPISAKRMPCLGRKRPEGWVILSSNVREAWARWAHVVHACCWFCRQRGRSGGIGRDGGICRNGEGRLHADALVINLSTFPVIVVASLG